MHNSKDPVEEFTCSLQGEGWGNPFPAFEALCQSLIGHKLFSCSAFELNEDGGSVAARIYTSDEANYPTSGVKEIVPNRWTGKVIDRHETFVANSVEGFSDVFPDHELIKSLGLGSVINLPVILRGKFIGTVNMLHEAGFYTEQKTSELHRLLLPAMMSFQLAGGIIKQ